jgi:hypothetical protein
LERIAKDRERHIAIFGDGSIPIQEDPFMQEHIKKLKRKKRKRKKRLAQEQAAAAAAAGSASPLRAMSLGASSSQVAPLLSPVQ